MQKLLALAATAALVLAPAACGPAAGTGTVSGGAPDFRLRTTTGQTFHLGEHLGNKVILLSFWTSFCSSCRNELTQIQPLYAELRDRGFLPVAVALDGPDTVGDVRPAAERMGLEFPVVLDEESRVAGLYNPRGATPFSVLIDHQGRRAWSHEGFVPSDMEDIRRLVTDALAAMEAAAAPAGGTP